MNRGLLSVIFCALLFTQCSYENLDYSDVLDKELRLRLEQIAGSPDSFLLPNSDDLASIPQDEIHNPLTKGKVELGKMFFFETGLGIEASQASGMATYSCATCHDPSAAFKPGIPQGIADGGFGYGTFGETRTKNPAYADDEVDAQGARPLSLLNVAFVENTFWNGQFGGTGVNVGTEAQWNDKDGTSLNELGMKAIETQNIEGVHVHRMNMTPEMVEKTGYKDMLDQCFPEMVEDDRYSQKAIAFAVSAYIRTLIPNEAPFQKWLRGDHLAMADEEKKGALLFFGKARCFVCHSGPGLSSVEFHRLGVKDLHDAIPNALNTSSADVRNLGRGGFTGKDEDMFAYKVPQLYNMADNPFFFHGASKSSLEEVIEYKLKAESENPNVTNDMLSSKFLPVNLSEKEKKHLLEFLKVSLKDPELDRFAPRYTLSGECYPNNDPRSRRDLGCE